MFPELDVAMLASVTTSLINSINFNRCMTTTETKIKCYRVMATPVLTFGRDINIAETRYSVITVSATEILEENKNL